MTSSATEFTCSGYQLRFNTKPGFPKSRSKHVCCVHENHVYLFAGKDGHLSLKDLWRFDLATATWESLRYHGDKPPHLEGHTLIACKKLLLLFGGEYGDALTDSSLWVINPDLGYIRKISPDVGSDRPCARRYHSAVLYDGSMFVYGGYVDLKGSNSELWCYAVDDEEWTEVLPNQQLENSPGCRHGHSAIVYNKCMWVYGGLSDLTAKQDFWRFRFGTRRWTRLKFKYGPPPLTGHAATVVNDKMLLFGGESNREPTNQLWCFSFSFSTWTQMYISNQVPSPVSFHAAVMVLHQTHSDPSIKAHSVPQLQQKMRGLSLERPQSSPAYSSSSSNQTTPVQPLSNQNKKHTQMSNQLQRSIKFQNGYEYSSNSGCRKPPDVLDLRGSSESVTAINSSPQENTEDGSPLILKETDFNYNAIDITDIKKMANGIDNPGVSKSTEELIRESRLRKFGVTVDFSEGEVPRQSFERLNSETEVTNGRNSDRPPSLQRHHSEGVETLISKGREAERMCVTQEVKSQHSRAKKKRKDTELVVEDIEDCDCIPKNIEVPFPSVRLSLDPLLLSGSQDCLSYSQDLEAIMLQDLTRGRSRSVTETHFVETSLNVSSKEKSKSFITEQTKRQTVTRRGVHLMEFHDSHKAVPMNEFTHDKTPTEKTVTDEFETSLSCLPNLSERKQNRESKYQKNSSVSHGQTKHLRPSKKQPVPPQDPYLLILGGKEKNGVSFQVKPLSMWKISLKNV